VSSDVLARPRAVIDGPGVLRVEWVPGSDRLRGRCHCGAQIEAEDPIEIWDWLLGHPDHPDRVGEGDQPAPAELPPPPPHVVTDPARIVRRPAVQL
jgi:hypothetical protein